MAKVKAKLPASVAAQLDNAEFLLNRTLTYEEFYETLNRADMSYLKSLESRGKPPAKRDHEPTVSADATAAAAEHAVALMPAQAPTKSLR